MSDTLLLVTHVPVRKGSRGYLIDDQTAAGIQQWCRHFDGVTYVGIEEDATRPSSSSSWVYLQDISGTEQCKLVALPNAYRVKEMARSASYVSRQLKDEILHHRHLCFTIGGLVGDWPALAAVEAMRQKRSFVAWIDRVEPEIIRRTLAGAPLRRRLKAIATLPLMERLQRFVVSRSTVTLLQGGETFQHFSRWAPNPHCIYDTHTTRANQIAPGALVQKQARITRGEPLRIIYIGRAAAMKGPGDWLGALENLQLQKVPFQASWIGDGPNLAEMKARLEHSSIASQVSLPGFEGHREPLLSALRESDILLFCHKTPESPRCLIEALVCGTPLVGYDSAYPQGLVQQKGGGVFASQDDVEGLANRVAELHRDRPKLAQLVADAAASGSLYDEDSVYAHRAALMKSAE